MCTRCFITDKLFRFVFDTFIKSIFAFKYKIITPRKLVYISLLILLEVVFPMIGKKQQQINKKQNQVIYSEYLYDGNYLLLISNLR